MRNGVSTASYIHALYGLARQKHPREVLVIGCGWYLATGIRTAGFLWYTVIDNHLLNAIRLRNFPDEDIPLTTLEFLASATRANLRRRIWRRKLHDHVVICGFGTKGRSALHPYSGT